MPCGDAHVRDNGDERCRPAVTGSTVVALFLGMQRSATVFHGVREAKVTTNWRGTESACTYRFDPLGTVRVVVLGGKQVTAREALLQPPWPIPLLEYDR